MLSATEIKLRNCQAMYFHTVCDASFNICIIIQEKCDEFHDQISYIVPIGIAWKELTNSTSSLIAF